MDETKALKAVRARKLGNLTRTRKRAFILIETKGSRTQLAETLKDLDVSLDAVEEANDKYVASLKEEGELHAAEAYMNDVREQHDTAVARIEEHLASRIDEAPSVISAESRVSSKATDPGRAQITARVRQLELQQLQRRLELERQEQEMKRKRQLQEAIDAEAAARLEEQLLKDAEGDLSWDRRNDFVGEPNIPSPANTAAETGLQRPANLPRPAHYVDGNVLSPAVPRRPPSENVREENVSQIAVPGIAAPVQAAHVCQSDSLFHRSLPRLTLPMFDGNPDEWVKWYALFRILVHDQPSLTPIEKMAHLQAAVTGLAQRTIGGMLYRGELYEEAVRVLKDRFGRDDDIIHSNLDNIFSCPDPTDLDPASLERFQATVHCAVAVFQSMGHDGDLYSYENLRRVVEKLPTELKRQWSEHVLKLEPEKPSLLHLDTWLCRQVRIALNFAAVSKQHGRRSAEKKHEAKTHGSSGERMAQRTALATEVQSRSSKACICCEAVHDVTECPAFLSKTVDERAIFVASSGACFFCLKKGHAVRTCRFARQCGIEGCKMRHHQMLHGSRRVGIDASRSAPSSEHDGQRVVAASSFAPEKVTTLLQVVEVTIVGRHGKTRKVCALLDPGSQTSLVSDDVVEELGLQGEQQTLQLRNVEGNGSQQRTRKLQLNLLTDGEESYSVSVPEAFSIKDINLTVPHYPVKQWRHVQGLKIADCRGRQIELLLGANVIEAVLQLEVRTGNPGDPVAIRTTFGWTLTGSVAGLVPGQTRDVMLIHRSSEESELCSARSDCWTSESLGSMFEDQTSCSLKYVSERADTRMPEGCMTAESGLILGQDMDPEPGD